MQEDQEQGNGAGGGDAQVRKRPAMAVRRNPTKRRASADRGVPDRGEAVEKQRGGHVLRGPRRDAKDVRGGDGGNFCDIPPDVFPNILKFLSAEDLSTCADVCKSLRLAASDERLWCKLYCLRWGLANSGHLKGKPRGKAWKALYFEQDRKDIERYIFGAPPEFRDYYIQMQAAKRSEPPPPYQIRDDAVVNHKTISEHETDWRRSHNLPDVFDDHHFCSGETCSYKQIGDIYICEKTGRAHVCDETCKETVLDSANQFLVCAVSGRCFVYWLDGEDDEDFEEVLFL